MDFKRLRKETAICPIPTQRTLKRYQQPNAPEIAEHPKAFFWFVRRLVAEDPHVDVIEKSLELFGEAFCARGIHLPGESSTSGLEECRGSKWACFPPERTKKKRRHSVSEATPPHPPPCHRRLTRWAPALKVAGYR